MNIVIEKLPLHPSDSDVCAIDRLVKQISQHLSATFGSIFQCQHLDRGRVFVARNAESNTIVGIASIVFVRKVTGLSAWVETVVVDESCRGQQLGEKLMQSVVAYALEVDGIKHIDLTSNPARTAARALYQKLGFREKETGVFRLVLG